MPILKDAEGNDVEVLAKDDVAEMVTGAVRSQIQKATQKLTQDVAKQVSEGLQETVAAAIEESQKNQPKPPNPKPDDDDKTKIADNPEFRALQKQLEEQRKATERIQAERDAERERAQNTSLQQQALDGLAAVGLTDGARARHALLFLRGSGRLEWDEHGERVLYRDADGSMPLADGLKNWAASDEAKIYLPPRGAGGSGGSPGSSAPSQKPSGKDEAAAALSAALQL